MVTYNQPLDSHVSREQEIGLRLPNGTAIFPPETWHEHPLVTAADREAVVGLIRAAAVRLGYDDEDHFLPHYGWATREKICAVVYEQGEELPLLATGFVNGFHVDETVLPGYTNGEAVPDQTLPNEAPVG